MYEDFGAYGAFGALLAGSVIVLLIFLAIVIAFLVFYLVGMCKLYAKAGKPAWAAIVPFYNNWVFFVEMLGLKWWWFVIAISGSILSVFGGEDVVMLSAAVSLAGFLAQFVGAYNACAKIGRPNDMGYTILLTFLGGIMYPILGYSKDTVWNANTPVSENGFFDKDKVVTPAPNNTNPAEQPSVIPAEEVQRMSEEQSEQK